MKSANYNYTDEAGSHQKWKRARRIHLITPLSTNCPSMLTRKPPTVAGTTQEATAERHEDGGERCRHQVQLWLLFTGDPMRLVGDLGKGWDTCQVETAGQALSNSPLKSAVMPQECLGALSFHKASPGGPGPEAFAMMDRCIPWEGRANAMKHLDTWAKILFAGAREGSPGQPVPLLRPRKGPEGAPDPT